MSSEELDSLVRAGLLKPEPADPREFNGLVASASNRLADARNERLARESRFDLAYGAAHGLALAALRWHGYRPSKRYIVFQALGHTLNLPPEVWRVLDKCHSLRNLAEYEGTFEPDEQLLPALLSATERVEAGVLALPPIQQES